MIADIILSPKTLNSRTLWWQDMTKTLGSYNGKSTACRSTIHIKEMGLLCTTFNDLYIYGPNHHLSRKKRFVNLTYIEKHV